MSFLQAVDKRKADLRGPISGSSLDVQSRCRLASSEINNARRPRQGDRGDGRDKSEDVQRPPAVAPVR